MLIPDFELSTRRAREALPDRVSLKDAVFNVSHGAMTLKALELGDEELLRLAMEDRLHQNYRKGLIEGFDRVEAAARDCGAAGFCISGAGPTLVPGQWPGPGKAFGPGPGGPGRALENFDPEGRQPGSQSGTSIIQKMSNPVPGLLIF